MPNSEPAPKSDNITWHKSQITQADRTKVLGHHGCTLWLTGLSGSGKSTIAVALEHALIQTGHLAYRLDGDNIRHGLNKNLSFSPQDRTENIRRIGQVAKLFTDAGIITICSFISPYQSDRDQVRKIHQDANLKFLECFINTPIELCESRDPKGLYKKARAGEIKNFTGIDDPYETPTNPEINLKTANQTPEQSAQKLIEHLQNAGILRR